MNFEDAYNITAALTAASAKTRAEFKAVVDGIYLKHFAYMVPALSDVHSVIDSLNWKFISKSKQEHSVALLLVAFEKYLSTGKEPDTWNAFIGEEWSPERK